MRRIYFILIGIFISVSTFALTAAEEDSIKRVYTLDEVTVTSIYRSNTNDMEEIKHDVLVRENYGQEPSHIFKTMPSIYARTDNGTEFGYGYYYIRGLDQTRINVTLDGMPWNEAEDFGTYFANSPDLMASMHSVKVERGTSSRSNGVSASAGNITLESVDLRKDTTSYAQAMYGSFNTYKASLVYNMGVKKGFGLHLKATHSHTDGYKENSFNNSHALTAKLGYFINDRHVIDVISINGYHANCQGWIGVTQAEIYNNARANGNTKNETDNWIQSVNKIQYKGWITDNTLLSASAYLQYQTGSYRFDLDNYMTRVECDPTWPETGILYDYGLTHYLYGGNVITKSTFEHFSVYGGANVYGFQREHFMDDRNIKHTRNVSPYEYYDNFGYKTDANLFVGGTATFGGFSVGANIQYRHVEFSYYDKLVDVKFSSSQLHTNWNFVNGGIDLAYNFNKDHSIYAKLAVSNREPMRSDMFGGNETLDTDTITKYGLATTTPELSHDVEFGWEGKGNFFKANVNLFYMHFKNELILNGQYSVNGLPLHENAKNSYRTGVEVSFDIEPVNGLHLVNGTSYSYGKVNSETFRNSTHIFFPSWTLNQDVHYDKEFGNIKTTIGASYDFRSSIFIDLSNTHSLPDNMSLNAYATLTVIDKIEFSVRFNNITNHQNYSYGSVNANGDILYIQEAKFNCLGSVRYYF